MEPISGLAALYEILRRKVTDGAKTEERSATTREPERQAAQRATLEELERHIRSKLKGSRDALHTPALKRWVIGSLLSWELDDRLPNEPKFNALVRKVQQSIDADARLKAMLERVMEQLSR